MAKETIDLTYKCPRLIWYLNEAFETVTIFLEVKQSYPFHGSISLNGKM
jgi:hypothetical protein